MVEIMAEGGVVELVVRSWVWREKFVEWMPVRWERAVDMSVMQVVLWRGTEKVAWYGGGIFFGFGFGGGVGGRFGWKGGCGEWVLGC